MALLLSGPARTTHFPLGQRGSLAGSGGAVSRASSRDYDPCVGTPAGWQAQRRRSRVVRTPTHVESSRALHHRTVAAFVAARSKPVAPIRLTAMAAAVAVLSATVAGCDRAEPQPTAGASAGAPAGPGYAPTGTIASGGFIAIAPRVAGDGIRYSISPPLPARLALDPDTGLVSGFVGDEPGTRTYSVEAANSAGALRLSLTISVAAPLPASCPGGSDGRECNRFHQSVREFAIAGQLAQGPDAPYYLVIGDSLVEAARLDPICGLRPLNGGVGGARVADLVGVVRRVGARDSLRLLVIAAGVNDASPPRVASVAEFEAAYETLLADAGLAPDRIIMVGIAPLERDKPLGTGYFDAPRAREFDRAIRMLAARTGATYVDLGARLGAGDGTARIGSTTDGVHLTPATYDTWRSAIADAAGASRGCVP
ncbi:MAG: GDSL-type esterase/lipase family protein [Steroidobacteraceae bacterium]|nr:GDSL-type esterase/lipase family protein [Steroidobacteraceae bacterium]